MNWKRYFSKIILERGKTYYQRGKVRDLSYKDDVYHAKVVGNSIYKVEIKIRNDKLIYMECSCPYAQSGNYCKHMAAVMYAVDREGDDLKQIKLNVGDKKLHPFQLTKDTYQYFDVGRFAGDVEVTEALYAAAKKLIEQKKITLDEVQLGYKELSSGSELGGMAVATYRDSRCENMVRIIFNRRKMTQASCGVLRCDGHYGTTYYYERKAICKHILAVLILLDEYLKKNNPGDATDGLGNLFLRAFRSKHVKEVIEQHIDQSMDLKLEPVLEKNVDKLDVTFKAGIDKMYVVKNLTEFVKTYENQGTMEFGTKTEIDFAKHRIAESSEEIYEYVRSLVRAEQDRNERLQMNSHYYYEPAEIKNKIGLYGKQLDEFFTLYENRSVACNDKSTGRSTKRTIRMEHGKPEIAMEIGKDMDEKRIFHGIHVKGSVPVCFRGDNAIYFSKPDALCRVDEEVRKLMEPLLDMGQNGEISFSVGRNNLSEFYYQVMPVLKQAATIVENDTEIISGFIPPEPVFAFYLDSENGVFTCKPKARYGENEVSMMDHYKNTLVQDATRLCQREEEMLYYVGQYFPNIDMEHEELHCDHTEDALLHILDGGVERLMALGEVHTTERFRNVNVRKAPKLKVGVSVKSDILDLTVSSDDLKKDELLQLLQDYRRKKKYYRLKNGDFVIVNEADMDMLSEMMETLNVSPKEFVKDNMKLPVYRALYLNKMLEQGENVRLNRDKHFKNLIKEFKTVDDSEFEVPESLTSVMRNYQVKGFQWLKTLEQYRFGGILADDMGLGKTLQMISVLLSAKESAKTGTSIIISPASLVYNWGQEFAKFAPEMKVRPVTENQKERVEIIREYQNYDVLITSYDLLKRDIAEYEDINFEYQVLDEAQYIKNHSTAAAKAVKVLKSAHRFALTGTPIENRLSELWSIFDYLMPGFLYSYEVFRRELETPIVKYKDEDASNRLRRMVAPFILRRLKGDVLKDLPDKIEEIRYAKFEGEQQQLYHAQVLHMKEMIANQGAEDFQKNKLQILAELTKIRQICCDPELLFDKYGGSSAKRHACVELIQSAIEGEHKILVFSQFTSMLELLEKDLKREKISYYKITGSTSKEKRVELVNEFNKNDTSVFLISLKAGGTGLNLTGADVVIHYDPWWNQAAQNQATDRAHRIGQTKIVSVYKLIAKDTIEEKIVKMQESKKDLAETILSGEMGGIGQMSKEEIMALLVEEAGA